MKKDEITMVRLLSLAILMALSLFILLVPIGSNEFGQIISKMNNNALKHFRKARIQYIICIIIQALMLFISCSFHLRFFLRQCLWQESF